MRIDKALEVDRTEIVDVSLLVEDPENARAHDRLNLKSIAESLVRFGQVKPVVARRSDNTVVAGSGTLIAAREILGWKELLVIWTDLEGDEAAAYGIADNRTAETSRWNLEVLSKRLQDMDARGVDLQTLGWRPHELEPLLRAEWIPPEEKPLDGFFPPSQPLKLTEAQREVIYAAAEIFGGDPGEALVGICLLYMREAERVDHLNEGGPHDPGQIGAGDGETDVRDHG